MAQESEPGKKTVFSAISDDREAAPPDLFKKQVRRGTLVPDRMLGAGEFGEVYMATQKNVKQKGSSKVQPRKVAVKLLKSGAAAGAKEEFVREARMILRCGDHPCLVRMIGVAVQQAPWLCVLEFLEFGDLRGVVRVAAEKNIEITPHEVVVIGRQLADGCAHICSKGIVHMDLAARNVLVGSDSRYKIADFGMAKLMDDKGIFKAEKSMRVAIKWTALEGMTENIYSEKSDVWALGVIMWEVMRYGSIPYPGIPNIDVPFYLLDERRLIQPAECPDDVWAVVTGCWVGDRAKRWGFAPLLEALKRLEQRYGILAAEEGVQLRDLGPYITKSKGEKKAKKPAKAAAGSPGGAGGKEAASGRESLYVYDAPMPDELGDKASSLSRTVKLVETAAEVDYEMPVSAPAPEDDGGAYDQPLREAEEEYEEAEPPPPPARSKTPDVDTVIGGVGEGGDGAYDQPLKEDAAPPTEPATAGAAEDDLDALYDTGDVASAAQGAERKEEGAYGFGAGAAADTSAAEGAGGDGGEAAASVADSPFKRGGQTGRGSVYGFEGLDDADGPDEEDEADGFPGCAPMPHPEFPSQHLPLTAACAAHQVQRAELAGSDANRRTTLVTYRR